MNKIEPHGSSMPYLMKYHEGKIQQGLGIGCQLDDFMRIKKSELCLFLGHDGVGKTYVMNWIFLCHVLRNNLKVIMWSGENQKGQIMRDLIQMTAGKPFKEIELGVIRYLHNMLEESFTFVSNKHLYRPEELIEIFGESDAELCLIDPFTGLDRDMGFESNYRFLNQARHFVNTTSKTLFINTHPVSASGRAGNFFTEGDFKGCLKAPNRSDIEGGKSFLNRCDFLCIIHRLTNHPTMKFHTMLSIEKVKDTETGGAISELNSPILAEYNYGMGMKVNGVDPLAKLRPDMNKITKLRL